MMLNIQRATCLGLSLAISFSSYTYDSAEGEIEEKSYLDILLDNKIEKYQHIYPEIFFLVLKGGKNLVANMMTLDNILGQEPVSLDYQHPPELRKDLMFVSANRILQMLQYNIPSAALFEADKPLEAEGQDKICVLTINPNSVASDSIQATKNLLGMSYKFVKNIPDSHLLSPTDYLEYVIDHEVYHCLQSRYIGPQPMSKKALWGDYWHHLSELGADSFALGMHIKENAEITPFVTNINRIRGTVLYTADPNHLTCSAVDQLLKTPTKELESMSIEEIFIMASEIRNKLSMSYDEYLQFMASAAQAIRLLGVNPVLDEDAKDIIDGVEPDPTRVRAMIDRARLCLKELGG